MLKSHIDNYDGDDDVVDDNGDDDVEEYELRKFSASFKDSNSCQKVIPP